MINPNGIDLDNMSRADFDELIERLVTIIEESDDTEAQDKARNVIKGYEDMNEDTLVKEIKSRGWDVEVHTFGITVIESGVIRFHGREDEVRAWLNK